ncbi:carbamoyltransferase HypF [Amycolatopsis sp. lyj-84]|uniref:carbamoyltransferase HypF n=1 Tax=Amycolatopsis sp. lyj-84 TaxID=2789284 RepID=UPI00397B4C00
MEAHVRRAVRVEGIVQGVGFRPFVHGLATRLGLAGLVGNDGNGVFIEVEGPIAEVGAFLSALSRDAPALAEVERVTTTEAEPDGRPGFAIVASESGGTKRTPVSADSATCADCLRELADPADRRYRYPFVNCTACGPRFTIVRDVPYDRPLTTMAGFALCAACAAEYHDPADRRFHAQPVCCPDCGPRLRLLDAARAELTGDPVAGTAALLTAGRVVGIKGLGGYHLAVLASDEAAASTLRKRKHREDKPFAVMVSDVDEAARLCEVDETGRSALESRRRPIVLLPRLDGAPVAGSVAPGTRSLGLMLPYTPLHHLLLAAVGAPIVLTSGNISDEPIAFTDEDAFDRLRGIADAYLTHDRPIHIRTDDSVVRPWRGRETVLRRSRGFVPVPIRLPRRARRPVLACGAGLKNTFCLAQDGRAFVSHHIGDLENFETLRSFTDGIVHFGRLFDIDPEVVAHDLHPEYLSTKYALDLAEETGVDLTGVQHHHAHIASCLADNGETGPVLGVAFDGTGFGTDGTIWGGEFLLADLVGFERLAHLAPVPLPGGAAAIRQPWRMAAVYLEEAFAGAPPLSAVRTRNESAWSGVLGLARSGVAAPLTSSAGRLFDAVAALLGVRDTVRYEGQAAIELEQLADPVERGAYPVGLSGTGPLVVAGTDLVRAVAEDLARGRSPAVVAARFHNGVAEGIARCCAVLRERTGVGTVALSGGVFQNLLLLDRSVDLLTDDGFRVLTHTKVPANDGGISLGQAAVAAARDLHPPDREIAPDIGD